MKFKPEFWPTVITLVFFFTCCALGAWQIHRLFWKQDLIHKVETRVSSRAIDIPKTSDELNANEYQHVKVSGRPNLDKAMHFGMYYEGVWGVKIITPVTLNDGREVFVNLGWVPEKKRADEFWKKHIAESVELDAIIRLSAKKPRFAPENDTVKNYWFWYDFPEMRKFTGTNAESAVLEVVDHKWPDNLPAVPTTKIVLMNDHLQYAITWFLLAFGIVVIYFVYHYQKAKEAEKQG